MFFLAWFQTEIFMTLQIPNKKVFVAEVGRRYLIPECKKVRHIHLFGYSNIESLRMRLRQVTWPEGGIHPCGNLTQKKQPGVPYLSIEITGCEK